jgi:type IV pilus assembly protein PilX
MKASKFQRGAALVVSLVILAVVTLIGVASMQNSSLELKLVASTKDRATAFQAAEAALNLFENTLIALPPDIAELSNDCAVNPAVADRGRCFLDCSVAANKNGRCFQGTYLNGQGRASCALGRTPPLDAVNEINNNNAIPQLTGVHLDPNVPVNILVEFLCFVERPTNTAESARFSSEENSATNSIEALNNQLTPLFRLTAVANGDANRSHVVVQTTFRL